MVKCNQLLVFLAFMVTSLNYAQCDTNFLYLDYLELSIEDSTEYLVDIQFANQTDTLFYADFTDIKLIGINRNKECKMIVKTNKSEFVLENINEYLGSIKTKYRISIHLPLNHSTCVEAICFQADGLEVYHSQSMSETNLKDCIHVDSGPTGYSDFSLFETTRFLK